MPNKILTFVDASVLISAAKKPASATFARRMRALQLRGKRNHDIAVCEFCGWKSCRFQSVSNTTITVPSQQSIRNCRHC